MADLTPELLAQLNDTAQRWIDKDGDMYDDDGKVAQALDELPFLVAAAKERDQLKAKLEDESAVLAVIDQRDAFCARIDAIADALGDETEWTSSNDRGARALDLAISADSALRDAHRRFDDLDRVAGRKAAAYDRLCGDLQKWAVDLDQPYPGDTKEDAAATGTSRSIAAAIRSRLKYEQRSLESAPKSRRTQFMADLTPELLAQLERTSQGFVAVGSFGDDVQVAEVLSAVPTLVAAAKERDHLREAARLRDYATLEAWSGAATGLEASARATAQAKELEKLAGVVAPTAEQQRDAALVKVAALMVERNQLGAEVERLRGAKLALVHINRDGESLCGMELHEGAVPLTTERRAVTCIGCWILRDEEAVHATAEVERLRRLGLEAANIAARPEVTRKDILRAEKIRTEIKGGAVHD